MTDRTYRVTEIVGTSPESVQQAVRNGIGRASQTLLLTGLTRDGVFLVEGGEVVAGVNNFRFNESPVDLLKRAAEVGAAERTLPREWNDWFTRAAMPTVRVPDFNMSTPSPAS